MRLRAYIEVNKEKFPEITEILEILLDRIEELEKELERLTSNT